jgi:signal transduction histidine kinase
LSVLGWSLSLELIYFIYGLAFFSMGLAMWMESARAPMLAEARALRPLALFGFVHGFHEWLEMAILSGHLGSIAVLPSLSWFRLGVLVLSFILLLAFGLQVVHAEQHMTRFNRLIGFAVVGFYLGVTTFCLYVRHEQPQQWVGQADVLARYFLAVPAALLAAVALNRRARAMPARCQDHRFVHLRVPCLRFACGGFAIYALAQVFVSPVDMFPARYLNAMVFQQVTGFPVQLVRAAMAVTITVGLIRATRCMERERQNQFLAVQQARLEALEQVQRELIERENLRRELLHRIITAQEEERTRLARELHDETSQLLTAFSLNLATLQKRHSQQADSLELIHRLQQIYLQMTQSIRQIVHDLRPAQLDHLGLVPTLKHLVDESKHDLGLEVTFEVHGNKQRLDNLVEMVLYRVVQEALTNVSRHARTDRAWLRLEYQPERVILQIRDAGIGFEPPQKPGNGHGWGIVGMRERVEAVGGIFHLETAPGKGTFIEIAIPLHQQTDNDSLVKAAENEGNNVHLHKNGTQEVSNEDHSIDVGG